MGLEEIIDDIEKKKQLETDRLIGDARAQASEIIKAAKDAASKKSKEILDAADLEAKQIKARELSKANIEAKRLVYSAMQESLDNAYKELRKNIASYLKSSQYKALLLKLYNTALDEIGEGCTVYVRKDDVQALEGLKRKAKILDAGSAFAGGLIAVSADGKKELDYSMDRILEIIKPRMYSKLLKLITGSE